MTNERSPAQVTGPRPRPFDSPWFWICLFASVAAAALVAIGPKYRKREAQLESTFKMREHLARRNVRQATDARGDELTAESGDESTDEVGASNSPSDNDGLLKTTGPLIWILLAVAGASWIMLIGQKTATTRT